MDILVLADFRFSHCFRTPTDERLAFGCKPGFDGGEGRRAKGRREKEDQLGLIGCVFVGWNIRKTESVFRPMVSHRLLNSGGDSSGRSVVKNSRVNR